MMRDWFPEVVDPKILQLRGCRLIGVFFLGGGLGLKGSWGLEFVVWGLSWVNH